MPRFNLSPSLIGWFFYHDCERYLRYHATPGQDREKAGIPTIAIDHSPTTRALLDAGARWEEEVIRNRLPGRVRLPNGTGLLAERSFSIEESFDLLQHLDLGEAIYQATIPVSVHFRHSYGLDPEVYRFAPCRPDLILLREDGDGKEMLSVVDIKASEDLSISHRIQATLYAMIIDHALDLLGIDRPVDTRQAGIWLYRKSEPEYFNLHLNIRVIEDFFRYRLKGIFACPLEDVPWHITPRCEFCEFYQHCRREAEDSDSISQIPGLSSIARRYLREAPWGVGETINTISDLEMLLEDSKSDSYLDNCGSLAGQGDSMRATVKAIQAGKIVHKASRSLALPIYEDIAIILTLQKDPISDQIYALGFRRFKGKDVYETTANEVIFVARDIDDCTRVRQEFIGALITELEAVHDYNRGKEWEHQRSVQTYVYEAFEEELFTKLLEEAIEDPATAEEGMRLRFYYQDPGITQGSSHPGSTVSFPLIILTREIHRLLALPVPFNLRLPEVLAAIPSSRFAYSLNPNSFFWHEQSNALKGDAIVMAWNGKRAEAIDWVGQEISRRLLATSSILDGLRERVKSSLVRWPEKFQFPRPWDATTSEISRLLFIVEYESTMGARRLQELRSRPLPLRVQNGISIPLQKSKGNFWRLRHPLDVAVYERSKNFAYLLVPDGDAGEEAQLAFNDLRYRENPRPGRSGVNFAKVKDEIVDRSVGQIRGLVLDVNYGQNSPHFTEGDYAVLHPRFTDFTVPRYIDRLLDLDEKPEDPFIEILRDPQGFAVPITEPAKVSTTAEDLALSHGGLTGSQTRALQQMLTNRLTLVWGPPGTGKTHFLAVALLSLIGAKKAHGEPIRIGVTAFTHAAIENLLIKVQDLVDEFGLTATFPIYKLRNITTPQGRRNLKELPHDLADTIIGYPSLLLGGTVYSFDRVKRVVPSLDLLVVDEASQMRPAELALAISVLTDGGRLVLAGDDLQLPPVIQADYPAPDGDYPGLEDSIFAYLRHRDDPREPIYTCQLQENWRMNHTLSRFPAETLYGTSYTPATDEIGNQRIGLAPPTSQGESEDECLEWILNPAYPLVLCVLENVRTTLENPAEAALVAQITQRLRERLIDPGTGEPYPQTGDGDSLFWRRGLFIVSPHHAQIAAIQSHLARLRAWEHLPLVDTVDKMQGQEAEAVIVSYGVSDVETALSEAEFIYSRNRLNVSLTRGKAKCMVFLPRPLLEPPLDVVQDERAEIGLQHMLDLLEFCRTHGEEKTFDLGRREGNTGPNKLTVFRAKGDRS